ncbi:LysR family transcriptional regulator [Kordiimonas sp. SCSIO 12603]|uniref:LysR family transcriptional regulator n=1 Tax=Kordiimonas sp. SCSIO 12603 TaxID=2829596 RepID=UPI0021074FFD|nr:LysR family transcriptional regulator [Kordiimonas sp. SCSIO 12603]UTW59381.1 LysR family transcriptional regulator [Kordiimonas sp. SCSIO 12603]
MDISQAKTFLTVVELRNFKKAAEKLFVTQSTVSARIKSLEEQLGCTLFIRNKAGVTLTAAAEKFERHAQSIVQLWDHAKKEVVQTEELTPSLTIGARFGLWEPLLMDWLMDIRSQLPNTVINARIGTASSLIQKLHNGTMDICLVYTPYTNKGLRLKKLFEEKFVLVSGNPEPRSIDEESYMYVHWGSEFARKHKLHFPDFTYSKMSANLGVLAQNLLLRTGLMGYLPYRTIQNEIAIGTLHIMEDAPVLTLPVYMVYSETIEETVFERVSDSLEVHTKDLNMPFG